MIDGTSTGGLEPNDEDKNDAIYVDDATNTVDNGISDHNAVDNGSTDDNAGNNIGSTVPSTDSTDSTDSKSIPASLTITDKPISGEVTHVEHIWSGRIFDVKRTTVSVNGRESTRDIVLHDPVVYVLAYNERGEYLVEHEYRAGVNRVCAGLPAGFIEPNESPARAALRELAEETGLSVSDDAIELVGQWDSSQGFTNETAYAFRVWADADHTTIIPRHLDPDETVSYKWVPWQELYKMVADGVITSAVAVALIQDDCIQRMSRIVLGAPEGL